MGQVLHGSATTTEAIRRAIQRSQESLRALAKRHGINPKNSWFGRNRRLAKDFENLAETLATFVTLASIQLALRRLARA